MASMANQEEDYGVLLYYKYATIPDLEALFNFYESNCKCLSLLGRVRLSHNGVNVTVGGKLSALEEHIAAVKLTCLFEGTDFKLASCHEPSNDRVAVECGFTSLSIRIVKELVTLSSCPLPSSPPDISNAGKHLSAAEFHSVLHNVGNSQDKLIPSSDKGTVLIDARNLYETRIGKFYTPNVETLDPEIRQYSDLPSWIDNNSEKLRGNNILMYCTGGIRCEMASAYIRSKGAGFENVFQLYGGIQRYLEQFPDGGFFRGKNFVFDHRVSVGSSNSRILGTCLLCSSPFDDYSPRTRCTYCRMLVLICDNCWKKDSSYVCELCQKNSQCIQPTSATEFDDSVEVSEVRELEAVSTSDRIAPSPLVSGPRTLRKLRILCLHGFRQNASGFKGRTASLAKKLKSIAELVFVDAPHELSFIYQIRRNCDSASEMENNRPPSENCSKKFSWLVAPDHKGENDSDWKIADSPFDPLQYQKQTEGFDKSIAYVKDLYSKTGPFDGILGFSQGAAMAALVCLNQQKLKGEMEFRFAILCSGFAVNMNNCQQGESMNGLWGGQASNNMVNVAMGNQTIGMLPGGSTPEQVDWYTTAQDDRAMYLENESIGNGQVNHTVVNNLKNYLLEENQVTSYSEPAFPYSLAEQHENRSPVAATGDVHGLNSSYGQMANNIYAAPNYEMAYMQPNTNWMFPQQTNDQFSANYATARGGYPTQDGNQEAQSGWKTIN